MVCLYSAHLCLTVEFILLRCSVVYTVDSLSEFYLLIYFSNLYLLGDDTSIS